MVSIAILEEAGVVTCDTCPEVTPYNRKKYNHLMTNPLKAEHYLTSGLNRIPTSVGTIQDCVNHAFNPDLLEDKKATIQQKHSFNMLPRKQQNGDCSIVKEGLIPKEIGLLRELQW